MNAPLKSVGALMLVALCWFTLEVNLSAGLFALGVVLAAAMTHADRQAFQFKSSRARHIRPERSEKRPLNSALQPSPGGFKAATGPCNRSPAPRGQRRDTASLDNDPARRQ